MTTPDDPFSSDSQTDGAALLTLAAQGERDVRAGRSSTLADTRARMRALLARGAALPSKR